MQLKQEQETKIHCKMNERWQGKTNFTKEIETENLDVDATVTIIGN